MSVYKVVSINPEKGTQLKKKIYPTTDKYDKYAQTLIKRWVWGSDIKVYKIEEDKGLEIYKLIAEIKSPTTEEEAIEVQKTHGWDDDWLSWMIYRINKM